MVKKENKKTSGIVVIIPTSNRETLTDVISMFENQTLKPEKIIVIEGESSLTQKYIEGFNQAKELDIDLIAFAEDDDFYKPNYLEENYTAWVDAGRPDLFGNEETFIYSAINSTCFSQKNPLICPMMNTFMSKNAVFPEVLHPDNCPENILWTKIENKKMAKMKDVLCIKNNHSLDISPRKARFFMHSEHFSQKNDIQTDSDKSILQSHGASDFFQKFA